MCLVPEKQLHGVIPCHPISTEARFVHNRKLFGVGFEAKEGLVTMRFSSDSAMPGDRSRCDM
jgi:hypothetical protein